MTTPFMARTLLAAAALDTWLADNLGDEAFGVLKDSGGYVTGGAALATWWNYAPGDVDIIFDAQSELRGFIHYVTTKTSYRIEKINTDKPSKAREAVLVAEGRAKLDLLYHPEGVYDFNGTVDLSCCRVWYSPKTKRWFFHSPLVGYDISRGVVRPLQPHKTTDARIEKYTRRASVVFLKGKIGSEETA